MASNVVVGHAVRSLLVLGIAWRSAVEPPSGLRPVLGDLLVLDLWTYVWHRVVHVWPLAWRFHQVHHQDERFDFATALRFHPGDVPLFTGSRAIAVWALSIPLQDAALFEAVSVAAALFHHSNVRLPQAMESALGLLLVTPSLHRAHHQPTRELHDTSYGTVLSVWDRMFGTYTDPGSYQAVEPGLAGRPEEPLPSLLLRPFR